MYGVHLVGDENHYAGEMSLGPGVVQLFRNKEGVHFPDQREHAHLIMNFEWDSLGIMQAGQFHYGYVDRDWELEKIALRSMALRDDDAYNHLMENPPQHKPELVLWNMCDPNCDTCWMEEIGKGEMLEGATKIQAEIIGALKFQSGNLTAATLLNDKEKIDMQKERYRELGEAESYSESDTGEVGKLVNALNYLSSRILTHYGAIKTLGEWPPPRMMILYPTYRCNAKCGYCEYGEDHNGQEMSWDMLESVVDQAGTFGIESIELCGGGEPTLHPDFETLCDFIAHRGLKLGVLTNGWGLVHRANITPLLAECASYVRISLDAATYSTYAKVKRLKPDYFGVLTEAVRRLSVTKTDSCKVSGKFLLTPDNYREVVSMARMARGLGLDSAQFKEVRGTQELSHEQHDIARGLLALAREEVKGIQIIGDLRHPVMREKCRLCQLHTMVDADGSVYLCCYFRHRRDRHRIGSLRDDALRDIWGGQQHKAAMRGIRPKECNVFDCRFVGYHRVVRDLIWKGEGQFEFL
jgi:radical SAM protein with 4Fe4S-binding SPASM domain